MYTEIIELTEDGLGESMKNESNCIDNTTSSFLEFVQLRVNEKTDPDPHAPGKCDIMFKFKKGKKLVYTDIDRSIFNHMKEVAKKGGSVGKAYNKRVVNSPHTQDYIIENGTVKKQEENGKKVVN